MNQTSIPSAVSFALRATLLFGAGTPVVTLLVGDLRVPALAGRDNDQGLIVARALHNRGWKHPGRSESERLWFVGIVGFGGCAGPILLVFGWR